MNKLKLDFSPTAKQDLIDHMLYYENKSPGLGRRFAAMVVEHIRAITTTPYFRLRYKQVRCVPMIKFPFMIHYTVIEERRVIRIHAIVHTATNPDKNWDKDDWVVNEESPLYGLHTYDLEYYYVA